MGKGALCPFVLLTSSFYKFYFQIIHYIFNRDGRPTRGKNKTFGIPNSMVERYDDEFLIDLGIFKRFGKRIQFTSEFIDKVYKE